MAMSLSSLYEPRHPDDLFRDLFKNLSKYIDEDATVGPSVAATPEVTTVGPV